MTRFLRYALATWPRRYLTAGLFALLFTGTVIVADWRDGHERRIDVQYLTTERTP